MDIKPTQEQIKVFQNNVVWRFLDEWLDKKKESVKIALTKAKCMDEVIKLQSEYDTYVALQVKVKGLGKENSDE